MYDKLKQLLLEGLSGASKATLAHNRKFKELDKKRKNVLKYGDHPENEPHYKILNRMNKHMRLGNQAHDSVPTKRKANNRRLRRDISSLMKHEKDRQFAAKIAKRSRADNRKTQID